MLKLIKMAQVRIQPATHALTIMPNQHFYTCGNIHQSIQHTQTRFTSQHAQSQHATLPCHILRAKLLHSP